MDGLSVEQRTASWERGLARPLEPTPAPTSSAATAPSGGATERSWPGSDGEEDDQPPRSRRHHPGRSLDGADSGVIPAAAVDEGVGASVVTGGPGSNALRASSRAAMVRSRSWHTLSATSALVLHSASSSGSGAGVGGGVTCPWAVSWGALGAGVAGAWRRKPAPMRSSTGMRHGPSPPSSRQACSKGPLSRRLRTVRRSTPAAWAASLMVNAGRGPICPRSSPPGVSSRGSDRR